MNKYYKGICILFFLSLSFSSIVHDARMLAVSHAYTNMARGYSSVGINPANIALSPSFTMNFGSYYLGVENSMISIETYNALSGANMVDTLDLHYYDKNSLHTLFSKGLIFNSESVMFQ